MSYMTTTKVLDPHFARFSWGWRASLGLGRGASGFTLCVSMRTDGRRWPPRARLIDGVTRAQQRVAERRGNQPHELNLIQKFRLWVFPVRSLMFEVAWFSQDKSDGFLTLQESQQL